MKLSNEYMKDLRVAAQMEISHFTDQETDVQENGGWGEMAENTDGDRRVEHRGKREFHLPFLALITMDTTLK